MPPIPPGTIGCPWGQWLGFLFPSRVTGFRYDHVMLNWSMGKGIGSWETSRKTFYLKKKNKAFTKLKS